jgi:hypothetical protein
MAEHEQLSFLLNGLNPHDRALVERGWNTAIYYLEEKFKSTNTGMNAIALNDVRRKNNKESGKTVKQSTELPEPTGSSPEEKIKLLRSALIGLIGSSDRKELEGIEAFTRTYMAQGVMPQKDGTGMINAIHALLETEEKL